MRVKNTYIVQCFSYPNSKCYRTIFETFNGYWFLTTTVIGKVRSITRQEAEDMISKTQFPKL